MQDPTRDFILETNGSRIALVAVLKQRFEDTGLEHPVKFFSRSLTGSERNYVAYKLEMYSVVRAVEHFRMFLLGSFYCILIMRHSAIYFAEIYPRQLGLSGGSYDSLNIPSESYTNGDKTMLLRMYSQDFRLPNEMNAVRPQSKICSRVLENQLRQPRVVYLKDPT